MFQPSQWWSHNPTAGCYASMCLVMVTPLGAGSRLSGKSAVHMYQPYTAKQLNQNLLLHAKRSWVSY
jgi:hypothetical protein